MLRTFPSSAIAPLCTTSNSQRLRLSSGEGVGLPTHCVFKDKIDQVASGTFGWPCHSLVSTYGMFNLVNRDRAARILHFEVMLRASLHFCNDRRLLVFPLWRMDLLCDLVLHNCYSQH